MSACESAKSPKKPQRRVCAPALLHKGKHQSTTGSPPIAVFRVCEPCTESKDRTASLDRRRATMGFRVCFWGPIQGLECGGRLSEASGMSSWAYFLLFAGPSREPFKIREQIKLEELDSDEDEEKQQPPPPLAMASNSIFESFPSYHSCLSRGEYPRRLSAFS